MKLRQYETLFLVVLVLIFALCVRLVVFFSPESKFQAGQHVKVEHTFLELPQKTEFNQYFYKENLLVSLPRYPEFNYGENILMEGIIESRSSSHDLRAPEQLILKDPELKYSPDRRLAIIGFIRQKVLLAYKLHLPSQEAGLIAGIVLGVEDGLRETFREELIRSGMLHVVVASGSNIALVSGVVFLVLGRIMRKKYAVFITITLLFFYALLTGFNSPIVRASIMASFAFVGMVLGRQRVAFLSLILSGWLMLMMSPKLLSEISFQLSFSATLGIVLFQKIIRAVSYFIPRIVKEDFATTISAQIGALPFLLFAFGEVNLLSIFMNMLLLWTIPIIMVFGLISGIVGLIHSALAAPFLLLLYPLLKYFTIVVGFGSKFYIPLSITSLAFPVAVVYYVLLVWFLVRRKKIK